MFTYLHHIPGFTIHIKKLPSPHHHCLHHSILTTAGTEVTPKPPTAPTPITSLSFKAHFRHDIRTISSLYIVANSGPPGVRSATRPEWRPTRPPARTILSQPFRSNAESSYGQGFSLSLFVRGVLVRGRVNRPTSVYLNTHTGTPRGKVPHPRSAPDTNRLNGSLRDRDNRAELSPTRTD